MAIQLNSQKFKDLRFIISRNVFLLTNGILFLVVILLFIFNDTQAAIFLGIMLVLNMLLGLGQDIRAWIALENLQLLTAPHVTRLESDKSETSILVEGIKKGDLIKLKIGDQIPSDGTLMMTDIMEVNNGLITGESASVQVVVGDKLLAGSVVISGQGVMKVDSIFNESRIARMTEGVKTYSVSMSPIQKEIAKIITYSSYVLIFIIIFVISRGLMVHESNILIVKNIGALASLIVPQGLAFAMTLLFAYGAAHLFNRNILLQEINATEKLGRIRNLCMDKTGTLTENLLEVEKMVILDGLEKEKVETFVRAYLNGAKDTSQTITAIENVMQSVNFQGEIISTIPFSSWRSYGLVKIKDNSDNNSTSTIIAGAPESILKHLKNETQKRWLQNFLDTDAKKGKRIFCVALSKDKEVDSTLEGVNLEVIAVFVISSKLRPGIQKAIDFFQKRGVCIRIISGDNSETVCSIARATGINNPEKVITGEEMSTWSSLVFEQKAKDYTIFARTLPEQKEKIIEALKKDGFTAMVGDGANDALALKKADLGIAMFDGAQATRQVASVVLMNNSFTALPGGVELADSIIKNAEIFSSIFLYPAFSGLFLFIFISVLGYPFPITPLNVTLINYFTVGIPGILISYWTIFTAEKVLVSSSHYFLKRILPFIVWSSLLQSIITGIIFYMSPDTMKEAQSNIAVILTLILTGFIFFIFTVIAYKSPLLPSQGRELWYLAGLEVFLLIGVFYVPFFVRFFDISSSYLSLGMLWFVPGIVISYTFFQLFFKNKYVTLE